MLCSTLLILNKVDFSDLPHQYDWNINIKQEGQSNLAMDARGASAVSHLECRKTRIKLIGNPPATGVQRCVKLLGYFSASRGTKFARSEHGAGGETRSVEVLRPEGPLLKESTWYVYDKAVP